MDIHIKLSEIRNAAGCVPDMMLLLRDWTAFLMREEPPGELVMLTLEAYSIPANSCRIVFLYADSAEWLGREADFSRCIFSRYRNRTGQVVHLDHVRNVAGYLDLEASVRSEMFLHWPWRADLHLIANAELNSEHISLGAARWFARLISLLPQRDEGRPGG